MECLKMLPISSYVFLVEMSGSENNVDQKTEIKQHFLKYILHGLVPEKAYIIIHRNILSLRYFAKLELSN